MRSLVRFYSKPSKQSRLSFIVSLFLMTFFLRCRQHRWRWRSEYRIFRHQPPDADTGFQRYLWLSDSQPAAAASTVHSNVSAVPPSECRSNVVSLRRLRRADPSECRRRSRHRWQVAPTPATATTIQHSAELNGIVIRRIAAEKSNVDAVSGAARDGSCRHQVR